MRSHIHLQVVCTIISSVLSGHRFTHPSAISCIRVEDAPLLSALCPIANNKSTNHGSLFVASATFASISLRFKTMFFACSIYDLTSYIVICEACLARPSWISLNAGGCGPASAAAFSNEDPCRSRLVSRRCRSLTLYVVHAGRIVREVMISTKIKINQLRVERRHRYQAGVRDWQYKYQARLRHPLRRTHTSTCSCSRIVLSSAAMSDIKPVLHFPAPPTEDEQLGVAQNMDSTNIWSLKLPRFLLEQWETVREAGVELGTLIIDQSYVAVSYTIHPFISHFADDSATLHRFPQSLMPEPTLPHSPSACLLKKTA